MAVDEEVGELVVRLAEAMVKTIVVIVVGTVRTEDDVVLREVLVLAASHTVPMKKLVVVFSVAVRTGNTTD